jgi:hypothetical protein
VPYGQHAGGAQASLRETGEETRKARTGEMGEVTRVPIELRVTGAPKSIIFLESLDLEHRRVFCEPCL